MSSNLILRANLPRALAHRSPALRTALIQAQVRQNSSDASVNKYVPGGPVYKGTVNDPTSFPPPSRVHGSYHWVFERVLSAALVPLTVAAFVTSGSAHPIVDGLLGASLVVHSHIGFDSVIVDYLHTRKFPVWGQIATWSLRGATVATMVGIYQFNTNDIGLTELITKVWTA